MNLFRSEEHARAWSQFNPSSDEGLIDLRSLAAVFRTPSRRHLLDQNYMSRWYPKRYVEWRAELERIGKATAYWGVT